MSAGESKGGEKVGEENPDYFEGKWWKARQSGHGKPAGEHTEDEKDHHGHRDDEDGSTASGDFTVGGPGASSPGLMHSQDMTPAEKVRMILQDRDEWELDDTGDLGKNLLFCQMDVLCSFKSGNQGWKEMARWLKYEEKVEVGNRWSKPHVATTSLRSLFALREDISSGAGVVVLDLELKYGQAQQAAVSGILTKLIAKQKKLNPRTTQLLYQCLMKPHKHRHRKEKSEKEKDKIRDRLGSEEDLPLGFKPPTRSGGNRRASLYQTNYAEGGIQVDDLLPHKPNKKLLKKIPKGTEAANILIGHCEFLTERITVFARFTHAYVLADLTEVELPTRFILLALGPTHLNTMFEYEEIGRAMGGLFSDKVFCQVAYKAKSTQDLVDGMDEFIDGLTVLPPSVWDPNTRLDPPEKTLSQDRIEQRLTSPMVGPKTFNIGDSSANDVTLQRTGRVFGGLWADCKRRYPLFWSDIKDAFSIQCVASVIFLYFACITPIVTFGALLGDGTGKFMGTMETLLSGAICGSVWALFAGQPLIIVGATGPMLIFESLLYSFSRDQGVDFLSFRFWIGMWVVLLLMIFVAFDLSALVRFITRFTEESFAVLISLIFIYEAFKKTYMIWEKAPVNVRPGRHLGCHCVNPYLNSTPPTVGPNETLPEFFSFENFSSSIDRDCINADEQLIVHHQCLPKHDCEHGGWAAEGSGCDEFTYVESVPDVFLLSVFLFLGTYFVAITIRSFKTTPYFPSIIRTTIADFAVLLAILVMVGVDALFGIGTPKLKVPSELKTTNPNRNWVINPMDVSPWYLIILAILPALLAVILIFLDQQISAVIVNRREHKLKKGHGYHLDLFVLAILIAVCSVLGLPWFVAATVRSVTHVRSLIRETETSAPGERPEMLGVREQRMTGFVIHVLIGMSTLITGVLNYVPMAVLYGVFLYMGITSLAGVQFIERILLLLMPQKYQPDYIYLRHVDTCRVHIFTIIQIVCMVAMWVVKSVNVIAIGFPIMVLAVCFVRKAMDLIFTRNELYWMDHLLPDLVRREKEDRGEIEDDEEDEEAEEPEDYSGDLDEKDKSDTVAFTVNKERNGTTSV